MFFFLRGLKGILDYQSASKKFARVVSHHELESEYISTSIYNLSKQYAITKFEPKAPKSKYEF